MTVKAHADHSSITNFHPAKRAGSTPVPRLRRVTGHPTCFSSGVRGGFSWTMTQAERLFAGLGVDGSVEERLPVTFVGSAAAVETASRFDEALFASALDDEDEEEEDEDEDDDYDEDDDEDLDDEDEDEDDEEFDDDEEDEDEDEDDLDDDDEDEDIDDEDEE